MSEPTFFVLKRRLPATETPHMLGRLVAHFYSPLDNCTPESPRKLLPGLISSSEYFTDERDANLILKDMKDNSLRARLEGLLSVSHTSSSSGQLRLQSTLVRTWRLKNYRDVSLEILNTDEVRQKLPKLVPIGGKAYFITGIMTCVNAEIKHGGDNITTNNAEIRLPVAAIAAAAAGAPITTNLGSIALGHDQAHKGNWVFEATGKGEEVFAVEYRLVKRDWVGFGKVGVREADLRRMPGLKFGGGEEEIEDSAPEEKVVITDEGLNSKNAGKERGKQAIFDKETNFLYYP
jgi:hypothetical protein